MLILMPGVYLACVLPNCNVLLDGLFCSDGFSPQQLVAFTTIHHKSIMITPCADKMIIIKTRFLLNVFGSEIEKSVCLI